MHDDQNQNSTRVRMLLWPRVLLLTWLAKETWKVIRSLFELLNSGFEELSISANVHKLCGGSIGRDVALIQLPTESCASSHCVVTDLLVAMVVVER